jgi:hypothetical protein
VSGDRTVDQLDYEHLVKNILRVPFGDTNLDGVFDSTDLLMALQANRYEQESHATWATGDWNCDGVFGTQDLVMAFQNGGFAAGR